MIVFNVCFQIKNRPNKYENSRSISAFIYIVWGEDENQEALLPFYTLTSMMVCCLYIKCVENKRKTQLWAHNDCMK